MNDVAILFHDPVSVAKPVPLDFQYFCSFWNAAQHFSIDYSDTQEREQIIWYSV